MSISLDVWTYWLILGDRTPRGRAEKTTTFFGKSISIRSLGFNDKRGTETNL